MNIVTTIWEFFKDNPSFILFGGITLIQITPIKIDPWTKLMKWLGEVLSGNMQKQLNDLTADTESIKRDLDNKITNDMRWNILDFSNSCKNDRCHTKEEWYHVISQIAEYENLIENKKIVNGVMEEESKYLKELYQERCQKNDFL